MWRGLSECINPWSRDVRPSGQTDNGKKGRQRRKALEAIGEGKPLKAKARDGTDMKQGRKG